MGDPIQKAKDGVENVAGTDNEEMEKVLPDIVQTALENQEEERSRQSDESADSGDPRIVIVGCGGAGNNTVNRLYNIGDLGPTR